MTQDANAAQLDYWNAHVGHTWAECHAPLDRQIRPLGDAALAALAPRPGERLLDIGCGCGDTTLELAAAVGPTGVVEGVDLSRPMLDIANARPRPPGAGEIHFRQADAQIDDFAPGAWDGFYSRFGVMFFDDPAAAFANLYHALKPAGRFAFVCWRPLADNAWMAEPLAAAQQHLPPRVAADPMAPGPFAFADPERLSTLLTSAGFQDVTLTRLDAAIGAGNLEESLALTLRVGPLGSALREAPALTPVVVPLVRAVLARYVTPEGVRMPASVWIAKGHRGVS